MTNFTQIFKPYDIVAVPFPFTNKDYTKKRPALVISQEEYQEQTHHCILAMITSTKQSEWQNDVSIQDLEGTGLPGSSIIRSKLFTLDERLILRVLGTLSKRDRDAAKKMLKRVFIDFSGA